MACQAPGQCSVDEPETTHLSPPQASPYADYILKQPRENARERPMSAKFVNLLDEPVHQYWDDGSQEGKFQGGIMPGETTHGTYSTHVFFFKRKSSGEEVARYAMNYDIPMYIIHGNDPKILNSEKYEAYQKELQFLLKYRKEKGQPWLSIYPRDPPVLKIWEALSVGQQHAVESSWGHWDGSTFKDHFDAKLVALAQKPKVFLIENLISEAECEHIIDLARSRVAKSVIGVSAEAFTDETRTSRTGWIYRHESPYMERMFKRFADVLGMTSEQLQTTRNAEPLQVVHYATNQHYYNHFDFFATGSNKYRFSTLLMYLNNATSPKAGGGTGFPKAFGGKGLKVRPPRGSGLLFYSMLEDGNCDEYSEHTGLHVLEGEKWVANLWIWDPNR